MPSLFVHCILLLFNFIPKTANLKSFFFLKSYVFFGVVFQLCPTSLPIFLARLTISLTRESLISHTFIHHVLVRSERTCIMRCINYYYSFFLLSCLWVFFFFNFVFARFGLPRVSTARFWRTSFFGHTDVTDVESAFVCL